MSLQIQLKQMAPEIIERFPAIEVMCLFGSQASGNRSLRAYLDAR